MCLRDGGVLSHDQLGPLRQRCDIKSRCRLLTLNSAGRSGSNRRAGYKRVGLWLDGVLGFSVDRDFYYPHSIKLSCNLGERGKGKGRVGNSKMPSF